MAEVDFIAAKMALFLGDRILTILRDDFDSIPFPGHWDFPGGGREGQETPETCILRETLEEVNLRLSPKDLKTKLAYNRPTGLVWFFVAHLDISYMAKVRLGDEGQKFALMTPEQYREDCLRIPHFSVWLDTYLKTQN